MNHLAVLRWLTEPFHYEFMQRALVGCVLVGFTNGFLSAFIVLRRLALLADALSHSLLPGLAVGAIFFGLAPLGLFSGAVIAALLVGIGGQLVARSSRLKDETAIGALYTVSFAVGIILLKYSRVPVDLTHFLFGNILGVSNSDLWIIYAVGALSAVSLVSFQRPLLLALFEPSVAASLGVPVARLNYLLITLIVLAMIASLQAVGVVLSVGLAGVAGGDRLSAQRQLPGAELVRRPAGGKRRVRGPAVVLLDGYSQRPGHRAGAGAGVRRRANLWAALRCARALPAPRPSARRIPRALAAASRFRTGGPRHG